MLYQCRKLVLPTRVFFISGLITTTVLMAFEILIIWPFYNEISDTVTKVRNLLFLFSVLIFLSGEASRFLLMEWQSFLHFNFIKKQKDIKSKTLKKDIKEIHK